jgi:hypothetical protein
MSCGSRSRARTLARYWCSRAWSTMYANASRPSARMGLAFVMDRSTSSEHDHSSSLRCQLLTGLTSTDAADPAAHAPPAMPRTTLQRCSRSEWLTRVAAWWARPSLGARRVSASCASRVKAPCRRWLRVSRALALAHASDVRSALLAARNGARGLSGRGFQRNLPPCRSIASRNIHSLLGSMFQRAQATRHSA